MVVIPGLLYTKEHEWVKLEGTSATIGITDHAQKLLGEVTFVELPAVEAAFKRGDSLSVVESSKAASDVYAPVTGKVKEINSDLESRPELINQSCYEDGWICRMTVTDPASSKGLMDAKQYEKYLAEC
jgi:glycine cleavage system H protein